jgi:hypothetical protein
LQRNLGAPKTLWPDLRQWLWRQSDWFWPAKSANEA